MITCPWCGTHYAAFQSNCRNCGGPLNPPAPEPAAPAARSGLPMPPPPPRPISDNYVWKLLGADTVGIVGGVFVLLGTVFELTGAGMFLARATLPIGLMFLSVGFLFSVPGTLMLAYRLRAHRIVVAVLRHGAPAEGRVTRLEEHTHTRVNGRHPWSIHYTFDVNGQGYTGQVTTLTQPGGMLQPGQPVRVLYLPNGPHDNALYPHP